MKIIGFVFGWLLRRIDRSARFAMWFPLSLVIVCAAAGASLGAVYGDHNRPGTVIAGVFGGAFLGIVLVLLLLTLSTHLAKSESKQPEASASDADQS